VTPFFLLKLPRNECITLSGIPNNNSALVEHFAKGINGKTEGQRIDQKGQFEP
jgi:hypothetical protein